MSNKRKSNQDDSNDNNKESNKYKRRKITIKSLYESSLNIIKNKTEECIICMEEYNKNELINIHQDHFKMCSSCLKEQGKALLRNIDLLPWKCDCCQEILSVDILKNYMDDYDKLLDRVTTLLTQNSVSCPNCDYSYLLNKDQKHRSYIFCSLCHHKIIIKDDNNLKERENTLKVIELANENGWKKCPCCHEMIEKSEGCNQMTHRETDGSYTYFCYQCGDELDGNNIDTNGNDHFPKGSYNDCINTVNNNNSNQLFPINNDIYNLPIEEFIIDDEDINDYTLGNNINYNNIFNSDYLINSNDEDDDNIYDFDQHNINGSYQCPYCNYNGRTEHSLEQHMDSKSHYLEDYDYNSCYDNEDELYYCYECDKTFRGVNDIRQHMLAKGHH